MATSITATNKSPLIAIVAWLLLALATFSYVIRFVVKLSHRSLSFESDDSLMTGSLLFCIAQSVATIVRADHGFGKPLGDVLPEKINASLKAEMAANVFYILSVLLARLSLLSLITKLTPNRQHQFVSFALGGLIIVWSIISVFAAALECRLPNSWDYTREKCINRIAWWIVSDIVNILAETVLIMTPVYIICIVQWTVSKKILFSIPFIVRICTIAAYVVDIIIWKNFVGPSPDPFFAEWQVSVTTQVIQCSCLCSTCVLYLKSFLKSVETGFGLDYDLRSSGLELTASNLSSEVLTQSAPMPKQSKGSTKGRSESRSIRSNLRSDDSRRLR